MTTRTPGTQEKPYTILSFIDDYKQERWQEASKGTLQFKAMSRGRAALTLLLNPLLGRSDAVIFRYLNDSRGKVSILRRLIIELLVCLAARLRNAEIIWFAHNVDRESTVKHPVLNTLRRKIIGHFCARVLVTDESLIEEARARLPCMDQKTHPGLHIRARGSTPRNAQRQKTAAR